MCATSSLIDPMGTGYSLILDRERQNEVYSVEKDAEIFADFIEDWKLRENRMNSPVYLLAESYGTLRACVIPSMLLGGPMTAVNETRGLSVNGIILMGNAVTFQSGGSVFFESNVETMEPYVIWRLRTRFRTGSACRASFISAYRSTSARTARPT